MPTRSTQTWATCGNSTAAPPSDAAGVVARGSPPRPADAPFVPSQLVQWQPRLLEPMGEAFRLQIDVPYASLRWAIVSALQAAEQMGGYA